MPFISVLHIRLGGGDCRHFKAKKSVKLKNNPFMEIEWESLYPR